MLRFDRCLGNGNWVRRHERFQKPNGVQKPNCAPRSRDYPPSEYEILLVDNSSTDGSAQILSKATGVRVFNESKQGSYAARNHAVRESKGEFLAFTDSDCMPLANWLRVIERVFEDSTRQIVLGTRLSESPNRLVRLIAEYESKKSERVFQSDSQDVYHGFTNNMGVRRSTFDQFGPFDEILRGADTLFTRRVVKSLGCEAVCYDTAMQVIHAELDSLSSHYNKMYTYGRTRGQRNVLEMHPLNARDCIESLRDCLREGRYSLPETVLYVPLLLGGIVAWNFGELVGSFRKNR